MGIFWTGTLEQVPFPTSGRIFLTQGPNLFTYYYLNRWILYLWHPPGKPLLLVFLFNYIFSSSPSFIPQPCWPATNSVFTREHLVHASIQSSPSSCLCSRNHLLSEPFPDYSVGMWHLLSPTHSPPLRWLPSYTSILFSFVAFTMILCTCA